MRYLIGVLCFFIVARSFGQEIELLGRYGASFLGAESIDFVGKDSFYFSGVYCGEIVRGKGRCDIRDNMLYLFFERSQKKDTARAPVIEISDNRDGTSVVNITCADKYGEPIELAYVQLIKSNGTSIAFSSNKLGKAYASINMADLPVNIRTSALGYIKNEITIDTLSDYDILIFHGDNEYAVKNLQNGEVRAYEIEELSEEVIVMRPAKSGGEFRRYTKKTIGQ